MSNYFFETSKLLSWTSYIIIPKNLHFNTSQFGFRKNKSTVEAAKPLFDADVDGLLRTISLRFQGFEMHHESHAPFANNYNS